MRQTVLDVAAGRLDDSALTAVAERVAYNPHAVQTLTGQCRAVIREGGKAMSGADATAFAVISPDGDITWYPLGDEDIVEARVSGRYARRWRSRLPACDTGRREP